MLTAQFPYQSMADVKAAHESAGGEFFSDENMKFFGSEVFSELYGYRFFVSSTSPRYLKGKFYTVHHVHPDGFIDTVGEFGGHLTLDSAIAAAAEQTTGDQESTRATVTVKGHPWYLCGEEIDGYVVVFAEPEGGGKVTGSPSDAHYRKVAKITAPGKALRQVLAGPPRVYRIR